MSVENTLEEVRRIKEESSLHYLSQTPEERKRENEEVRRWAENAMGRPLVMRNSSMHRETATEELVSV
jgi:hypothetical protein